MKNYYPPIGIAHISDNLSDLVSDRIQNAKMIRIACINQPKTAPHFGTLIVIFTSFLLAKYFKDEFNLPTEVLIDSLENAPANQIVINNVNYTLCLSHSLFKGRDLAYWNTKLVQNIAKWAAKKSKINFKLRNYREIQAQEYFRIGLQDIIKNKRNFVHIMSPSDLHLKIRPFCKICGLVDKFAVNVKFLSNNNPRFISYFCPNHGRLEVSINDPEAIIDCNAPIRTVLRSFCFYNDKKKDNIETILINGADWSGVWMQRVYFDGLSLLNCFGLNTPFNFFAPQVLDETGAKLSKTIYLEKDAYSNIDKAWLSVPAYEKKFGNKGLIALWEEIDSWIKSPPKFFRNYTLQYFIDLLNNYNYIR